VLGRSRVPPGDFDLRLVGMNFYVDGELASTATGAAVLGNPAGAVAWLANTLAAFGQGLEAGQVIMPGSLVGAVDAKPGMTITAEFDRLGSVSLQVL
jgi:2-keto-4-pentenoate hydratase